MNENLDLTKILEGCPYGTSFYSTVYGDVTFVDIISNFYSPILFESYSQMTELSEIISFTKDGRGKFNYDGECTLFPSKDQRDWSKFERFWDKPKVDRFDINILQPFDKVLVRDYPSEIWTIELFSHKNVIERYNIRGLSYWWKQCIPYNEETKRLLGTKEDCPDYYKWWEE